MSNTGTVIAAVVVGAAVGYGVAKIPKPAGNQLIVVDATATSPQQEPDRDVSKRAGHRVSWVSSNGAPLQVELVRMEDPSTAPLPYTFDCKNAPSAACQSGAMLNTAVVGSKAYYEAKILPNGPILSGRIIIVR